MGHSTAVITVSTERAEQARKHVAASRVRNSWFTPTFASEMVDAAVRIWRDEEANRYDNSRAGDGFLAPVMSRQQADDFMEEHDERVVNESVVIPIAKSDDLVTKTHRVKVTLDAAEIRALRTHVESLRGSDTALTCAVRDKATKGLDGVQHVKLVKVPAARKFAASATEGKAVTRYQVIHNLYGRDQVLVTCDTQAEARAEALRIADEHPEFGTLYVIAQVVRVAGDGQARRALVVIERPEKDETTVELEVTTVTAKPDAAIDHYIVAFDYHH